MTSPKTGFVYFYCDHRSSKKQSLLNFLILLIVQLLRLQPECIEEIKIAHEASDRKLTDAGYAKLIKAILRHFEQVFIVVDALDEAKEGELIAQACADLLQFSTESGIFIRIVLTSREDLNVERSVAAIAGLRLRLGHQMDEDISNYISSEIRDRLQSRKLKLANANLADEIVRSLVDHAGGLCVMCQL